HRFQVKKATAQAIQKGHPWIYRRQCSSALKVLPEKSLLRLVGPTNEFLGWGIYEPLSAIAIRVFSKKSNEPTEDFFYQKLLQAWEKRQAFLKGSNTNAFRWVHGEADSFPGLNIDVYDQNAIAVFYLKTWQSLLKNTLVKLGKKLGLKQFLVKEPHGQGKSKQATCLLELFSQKLIKFKEPIYFKEGQYLYLAFPLSGQKTGFYLDLRPVRQCLEQLNLKNQRVLNLFAHTGSLSALAEKQGAHQVVSVEASHTCQKHFEVLKQTWHLKSTTQTWIQQDVWDYLDSDSFKKNEAFDLVILDPPSLAKNKTSSQNLSKTWKNFIKKLLKHLKPQAKLLTISCTDRLHEKQLKNWIQEACLKSPVQVQHLQSLSRAWDHPTHPLLKERDYFHALLWQRSPDPKP
ncbi:MAG: class I SAM-dependent rRNA methyltransferase, partial [Deltaproteobacteria bacterium]|nr:class I SAM-dependent rRNA methyltransferase [Deltaproteobacteria bacterium]